MTKSVITARITEEERQIIEQNASAHGMKVSPFIIYAATRENIGTKADHADTSGTYQGFA